MKWQNKLLIILAAILVIVGFVLVIKYQHDQLERQQTIETSLIEMKQLADGIARADSRLATPKDIENLAKELDIKLAPIREDLKKFDADIKAVQSIEVVTNGYVGKGLPSSTTEPKAPTEPVVTTDQYGYLKSAQVLKLKEPFGEDDIPYGEVRFKAWQESPWDLTVYPRSYVVTNVLAQDEDGRHYAYSKFGVKVNGETHIIKVSENKMVEELPSSKFRFNPTVLIGADFGAYFSNPQFEFTPNVQVALFSYSHTKKLPEWLFLGLGLGYATQLQQINFVISPVSYNIAEHIPLIQNLYLGPTLSIDTQGSIAIMAGVKVSL